MSTTEIIKTKWNIDTAHSEIGFKVKHLMIANVNGSFKEFDATIYTTDEDFTNAEIEISIKAASVETKDEKRDGHLKSVDFFDVESFREIKFTASKYDTRSKGRVSELYGELTIKGIKKPIKLDVEFSGTAKDLWGNQKAAFIINGKINRKDWGLNWNAALEAGGVLVSEDVAISCEVQLVKQS